MLREWLEGAMMTRKMACVPLRVRGGNIRGIIILFPCVNPSTCRAIIASKQCSYGDAQSSTHLRLGSLRSPFT